jgi:Ser/Thr protein kinase RdoA (MazF antagonist)
VVTERAAAPVPTDLASVLDAWGLRLERCNVASAGEGNINDSFFVGDDTAPGWRYVLQRINRQVFPDPAAVVRNQLRVIDHLRATAPDFIVPLERTTSGGWYFADASGVWRLQPFRGQSRTVAVLDGPGQAFAAASAFGRFQALLADLPTSQIAVAIPHFHDLAWHYARLDACIANAAPRVSGASDVLQFVEARRGFCELAARGPDGVIHGDCKMSNLLFAADSERVVAVIDLDTVMTGRRSWDFGDLVRSALAGDERQTPKPIAMPLYRALAQGFLDGGGERLAADPGLRSAMIDAPLYMTFMLGVRFLVDHLEGDRYFKQRRKDENLLRARLQFRLAESLEHARSDMARVLADM